MKAEGYELQLSCISPWLDLYGLIFPEMSFALWRTEGSSNFGDGAYIILRTSRLQKKYLYASFFLNITD